MCVPSSSSGSSMREALRRRVGELEQRAAGRAQVDRVEVAAVLDVGDVGVAEPDDPVLDRRLVLGRAGVEGVVVDRALAEATTCPAAGRAPRRARSGGRRPRRCRSGTGGAALGAEVLGAQGAAQEVVHRLGLADRGGGAVGAADRVLERHVAAVPGLAVVAPRSRRRSSTGCRTDARSRGAGCRSARSRRPRRRPRAAGRPSSRASRPGPTTLMVRSWFVPRRPIQPAWRYGKLVRIVDRSPIRLA